MSIPPAPEQKSLVGYTIGKCKLLRICGRGAMGTVYKGTHQGLDIEVAVKILPPHLALNSNLVERFLREAKLAARLNHINTVRVYDVGEEAGYYYLVMEFVDGTDALELLRRNGPQPAWVVADIGAGAARALDHAHKNDVIHRDIKPANLMLPNTGGVKVADFGLARALASESGLTMTGAIMGTPDYMAPEQAQGAAVGALADAYSLGATLYHLFVGKPPFTGATPMAVALQHVTSRIAVPEHLIKDNASRQLARVIYDLTQKEPARRAQELDKVAQRLQEVARTNKRTHKLLSEGATLFATVGVKLDTEEINRVKEEEAAAELDKGRVESPHLEKLRQAAKKARSGVHPTLPEKPAAPPAKPREMPVEMAELTGEMVREARARAKRSSGELKSLPRNTGDSTTVRRQTSNPDLSPHRETRPTGSSTRKHQVDQKADGDDTEWQSYAAKSFPTFDRTAIMDGSARHEVARTQSNIQKPDSGLVPPIEMVAPSSITQYPKASKSSTGVGLLVALLVIAGFAVGGWWFFLRDEGGGPKKSGGDLFIPTVPRRVKAADRGGITAVVSRKDGRGFFTGSEIGEVRSWDAGSDTPKASEALGLGAITALAVRSDGNRIAVGTSRGEVLELDAGTLQTTRNRITKLDGASVTALSYPSLSLLVIGDSKGKLRTWGGAAPVVIEEDGQPVTGLVWMENSIWAIAGRSVSRFDVDGDKLELQSHYPNLPSPVRMVAQIGYSVYAAFDNKVQRLTPQGETGPVFEAEQPFVGAAPGGKHLLVVSANGLAFLNPETLAVEATAALDSPPTLLCAAMYMEGKRLLIGTQSGEVLEVQGR